MEQLSFWEKLQVLGSNMLEHPLFIILLLSPVILFAFNKKITQKGIIAIYLIVLAIVLFIGNTTLFELFDNMMDGLFMTLYFPNFITLFVVEVLSAVITLTTFIKKDIAKVNRIINIVAFLIIQTMFCLVLTVIQVNNIDIYKENALYSNNDVLTLMQLLMGTFALQIITLVVIYVIDKVTNKLEAKGNSNSIENQIEELKKTKRTLPKNHITHIEKIPEVKVIVKEPEVKLRPMAPAKPLDKTLIKGEKIMPISLNDEIQKEEAKKNKPDLLKPMPEPPKKSDLAFNDEMVFNDFKPEYPEAIAANNIDTNNSLKTPELFDSLPQEIILKPASDHNSFSKKIINDQDSAEELITNLEIVNFDKMVKALKNLKNVYTL